MAILLINAGPGTGKTYSIVNAHIYCLHQRPQEIKQTEEQHEIFEWCKYNLPNTKSVLYLAFNTSIAERVRKQLPKHCKSYTFHGFGAQILKTRFGYQKVNHNRSANIVADLVGKTMDNLEGSEKFKWLCAIRHVAKLKEEWLIPDDDNIEFIRQKYPDLIAWNPPSDLIERCHRLMERMRFPDGEVEYVDQVWMGCQQVKKPLFDIGYVDEAQDLSRCRFELAMRACRNLVFVGDPNQAINAFAGADAHMFRTLEEKATLQLPLLTTFRCPPNIVQKANELRNAGIRSLPEKKAGQESRISWSYLPERIGILTGRSQSSLPDNYDLADSPIPTIKTGPTRIVGLDQILVLCRMNAPLVRACLHLINNDVPAFILKNDVADTLVWLVKSLKPKSLDHLSERLSDYVVKYTSDRMPPHVQLLARDKADSIEAVMQVSNSVPDLISNIESMFSCKPPAVKLTTIHKAKGLEAPEVFILNPPIEHPLGMRHPDSAEQEINLHFVAITRTSNNLTWVTE